MNESVLCDGGQHVFIVLPQYASSCTTLPTSKLYCTALHQILSSMLRSSIIVEIDVLTVPRRYTNLIMICVHEKGPSCTLSVGRKPNIAQPTCARMDGRASRLGLNSPIA